MPAKAGRDFKIPAGVLFHAMLTKERLDEVLDYNPETGLFTWRIQASSRALIGTTAGTPNAYGHRQIRVDGRLYYEHRLAFLAMTGAFPPFQVDHINGVRSDNRWSNLRFATHAENRRNVGISKYNTSGVTGVCRDKASGKWWAGICDGGKTIHLGLFTEFKDAVAARRAAEVKYFGEFSATTSRKILDPNPAS